MKLIKTFLIFESSYNFEEFVDVITRELMKYKIDSEKLNQIVYQKEIDIKNAIQTGVNPILFARDIVEELELNKSYNIGIKFPYSTGGSVKYM